MTKLLFTVSLFVALAQGNPAQPFPNHEQPPEGWYCVPAANEKAVQTDAHACDCRGMTLDDPEEHCRVDGEDDEGNPIRLPRGESSKCKVFCHKDSCRCAKRCETT